MPIYGFVQAVTLEVSENGQVVFVIWNKPWNGIKLFVLCWGDPNLPSYLEGSGVFFW